MKIQEIVLSDIMSHLTCKEHINSLGQNDLCKSFDLSYNNNMHCFDF